MKDVLKRTTSEAKAAISKVRKPHLGTELLVFVHCVTCTLMFWNFFCMFCLFSGEV